jgi:hypothetical protein
MLTSAGDELRDFFKVTSVEEHRILITPGYGFTFFILFL